MNESRLERFAPLAGLLFLLLVVAAIVGFSDTPSSDESSQKVIDYWKDNDLEGVIGAGVTTYAAIALVWFAGSLRAALARVEDAAARLASLAFGGALLLAAALLVDASLQFATAASADDVPPVVTETLATLFDNDFPMFLGGAAVFMIASGLAVLRHGGLPRWLGYFALVAGILSATPVGFVGLLLTVLWVGITGVVLFREASTELPGPTPAPAVPPAV